MIAFLRFEIVRTLRNVRFLIMLIAFPVLLYLIYAKQHGLSQGLTVATLLLVSMAVYSGMGSAMFASGPQLARERHNGWMRQLRISPITTPGWFAAKLAQSVLMLIPGQAGHTRGHHRGRHHPVLRGRPGHRADVRQPDRSGGADDHPAGTGVSRRDLHQLVQPPHRHADGRKAAAQLPPRAPRLERRGRAPTGDVSRGRARRLDGGPRRGSGLALAPGRHRRLIRREAATPGP